MQITDVSMKKQCTRCKEEKPYSEFRKSELNKRDGLTWYCKQCLVETDNSWRLRNLEKFNETQKRYRQTKAWRLSRIRSGIRERQKSPERFLAGNQVRNAVKRKKLEKLPCGICGIVKVEGHHQDYAKPLEVIWLCRQHHVDWHKFYSKK